MGNKLKRHSAGASCSYWGTQIIHIKDDKSLNKEQIHGAKGYEQINKEGSTSL